MKIIKYLSEEIGPRVAGSFNEYRASQYIKNEFERVGLKTEIQEFSFLNWALKERPQIWVEQPEFRQIQTAPFAYTLSTPAKGIMGHIRKIGKMYIIPGYMEWPKYCIFDDANNELGYFIVNPNGPAVPVSSTAYLLPEAGAIIGKDDAIKLDNWLNQGKEVIVRLSNPVNFELGRSQNVIGILGGGQPQIVVCAHYDSVPYSPGAVDNASGIQLIYNIANKLLSEGIHNMPTIAFVAMGCEELGLIGSRYYVKWLKENGLLESVKFCINIDMAAKGDKIFLRAGQGIEDYFKEYVEQSNVETDYEIKTDTAKASSDNWPFNEEFIQNVQIVALPFPLYHQETDNIEKMDKQLFNKVEKIGYDLINILTNKL